MKHASLITRLRELLAPWEGRPRMGVYDVTVAELNDLLDLTEAAIESARVSAFEGRDARKRGVVVHLLPVPDQGVTYAFVWRDGVFQCCSAAVDASAAMAWAAEVVGGGK